MELRSSGSKSLSLDSVVQAPRQSKKPREALSTQKSTEKDDERNVVSIFVTNIPPNTNARDMVFAFGELGNVADAVVPQGADGLSKGYAFVDIEGANLENLLAADIKLGGRKLVIRRKELRRPR